MHSAAFNYNVAPHSVFKYIYGYLYYSFSYTVWDFLGGGGGCGLGST
jgi:hypothetical protein